MRHEPGLPSLSYLALRDARTLTVATFISPDRLGYPPAKTQRMRLLTRLDALVATSPLTAAAAQERFPGDYHVVPLGVDTERFKPARKRKLVVAEWLPGGPPGPLRRPALEIDDWELVFLRTKPLGGRPPMPPPRRACRVRTCATVRPLALFGKAAIFVPSPSGLRAPSRRSPPAPRSPSPTLPPSKLAGAAVARLTEDAALRERGEAEAMPSAVVRQSSPATSTSCGGLAERRRPASPSAGRAPATTTGSSSMLLCAPGARLLDPAGQLLDHAEEIGLGAIAVTDHNVLRRSKRPTRARPAHHRHPR